MQKNSPQNSFGFLVNSAAFVIVVAGMKAAAPIIIELLLAVFIAVVITPAFIGMQKRGVSAPIALLVLITLLIFISILGVTVVGDSLHAFARNMSDYQDRLQTQISTAIGWLNTKGARIPADVTDEFLNARVAMSMVGNTVAALSSILGKAFVIILIVIFILFEAAILPAKVKNMPGMKKESFRQLQRIVDDVRRYMGMKTTLSLVTGGLITGMLFLGKVDFAILLGLLAFMLNYVPNIGSILAAVPGVFMALIQHGLKTAVVIAAGYLVINILIGNFIEPRVMGKGLGLSPLIVVVSLILWGWVLGPVGMLLSVPLTMTVKIVFESIESTRGIAVLLGNYNGPRE